MVFGNIIKEKCDGQTSMFSFWVHGSNHWKHIRFCMETDHRSTYTWHVKLFYCITITNTARVHKYEVTLQKSTVVRISTNGNMHKDKSVNCIINKTLVSLCNLQVWMFVYGLTRYKSVVHWQEHCLYCSLVYYDGVLCCRTHATTEDMSEEKKQNTRNLLFTAAML